MTRGLPPPPNPHRASSNMDAVIRKEAQRLGYCLPGHSTNLDTIQRDIIANMQRSVEACLEIGRGLSVLKIACRHGNFTKRLEAIGIGRSVAARFMGVARRFSDPSCEPILKAAGSQTKLFELLSLEDRQIKELAETGTTTGISLDKIKRLPVSALRDAIRKAHRDQTDHDSRTTRLPQTTNHPLQIQHAQRRVLAVLMLLIGHEIDGQTSEELAQKVDSDPESVTHDLTSLLIAGLAEPMGNGRWRLTPQLARQVLAMLSNIDRATERVRTVRQLYAFA